MFYIVRILVLLTITVPLLGGSPSAKVGSVVPGASDKFEVGLEVDADDAWRELIVWAEGRYASIGLELPDALVTVRPAGGCGGNAGRFVPGGHPEVQICVDSEPSSKVSRLIVLHELGHLWAENRLDDTTRQSFLEARGLTAWIDADLPTHEWGAEHAAEVLSWGLMDESVRIIRIYNASPDALAEAFVVLTGVEPLVTLAA